MFGILGRPLSELRAILSNVPVGEGLASERLNGPSNTGVPRAQREILTALEFDDWSSPKMRQSSCYPPPPRRLVLSFRKGRGGFTQTRLDL